MKRETKLIKNTGIIGLGMLCTKGVSFLLLPLYTSLLSTSDYGTVDFVFTLVSLIAYTLTLQFEQGVFRYLIDCRDNKEKQKKYITTTLLFIAFITAVGVLITVIVCASVSYGYTLYLVFNVIAVVFSSIICQIARGLDKTTIYTIGSFISASSQIVFNVVFIVGLKWNIGGMLTAFILGNLLCISFVAYKCRLISYFSIKSFDKTILKELLKYSLPLVPNTLCWWLINCSDRFIIVRFLGTSANGIYAIANKFPTVFSAFTRVYQMSWAENAAESSNAEDRDNYYSKIMNQSICFIIYMCAGGLALLPFIFKYLINSNYSESYYNILILLVAGVFNCWSNLYGSLFGALKHTKTIAVTTVFAAIVNVGLNLLFINKIGLYAASFSTLAAYIIVTAIRHFEIIKKAKIKYRAGDLLLAFATMGVAAISYCAGNVPVSIVVAAAVTVIILIKNKNLIIPIINKIKEKI